MNIGREIKTVVFEPIETDEETPIETSPVEVEEEKETVDA